MAERFLVFGFPVDLLAVAVRFGRRGGVGSVRTAFGRRGDVSDMGVLVVEEPWLFSLWSSPLRALKKKPPVRVAENLGALLQALKKPPGEGGLNGPALCRLGQFFVEGRGVFVLVFIFEQSEGVEQGFLRHGCVVFEDRGDEPTQGVVLFAGG